jgi:hypothetical protein
MILLWFMRTDIYENRILPKNARHFFSYSTPSFCLLPPAKGDFIYICLEEKVKRKIGLLRKFPGGALRQTAKSQDVNGQIEN